MLRRGVFLLLCALLPAFSQAANKPNIILITLDSTRADRMGFLGSRSRLTPNLDGLARQSLIFEHAYAQAPGTVVSHATILTGTYPQSHRLSEFGTALSAAVPYLPDSLHARGYRTAAFVGSIALDPKNGFAPGFDRGFNDYDAGFHQAQRGESRYQSVERRGNEVVARATAWLTRNPQGPFFLWVHLNDPHAPYAASYDRGISSADAAVGKLIAALRTHKLYDDALIVVAADHGESLGAHGEDSHGVFLYDETIHVPLLLKLPQNQMAGKRVAGKVRLVDVAPTIPEVAALPVPSQMQGQSLLRIAKNTPSADQPVYSRSDFPERAFGWSGLQSWRAGKYLYIRAPKPELYDLTADPGATHNLAQTSRATLDTIAGQLDAFDRRFSDAGGKSTGAQLSSSEMQKLASLGYVGLQQKGTSTATAATGTDPKDVIAIANKVENAMLAIGDGRPEKAIPALQQAVAAQPNLYLAQYALGVAYAQQQQYPQAVEHLHKAIEVQPDSAWAHYQMGRSLLKTGDFKTAAVHLEIATARLPEFADAHSLLAQAYDRLGRAEDSQRERSRATQLGAGKA
jgi:arylsulfatase A-like enzyme/Flp pilus assembly protein TadD